MQVGSFVSAVPSCGSRTWLAPLHGSLMLCYKTGASCYRHRDAPHAAEICGAPLSTESWSILHPTSSTADMTGLPHDAFVQERDRRKW